MVRWYAIPVTLVLLAAMTVPAASHDGTEKVFPAPLPISPENDTFYIFGTLTEFEAMHTVCAPSITQMWGEYDIAQRLWASNNPDDPCATKENANDRYLSQGITGSTGRHIWTINVYPKIADGTPLREGDPFKVALTLAITQINDQWAHVTFGHVQPRFTLFLDEEVLGAWDADGPMSVDSIEGPETGYTTYYLAYDVELDRTAPATLAGGIMNLTVDISNSLASLDWDDCHGADPMGCASGPHFRRLATNVAISIHPDRQGSIQIPFAAHA